MKTSYQETSMWSEKPHVGNIRTACELKQPMLETLEEYLGQGNIKFINAGKL